MHVSVSPSSIWAKARKRIVLLYSPENKPPPPFDLQVLAQVFLPCV